MPANPSAPFEKGDRVVRLLRVLRTLAARSTGALPGLTTAELAERLDISRRTAQRDLRALESEMAVPFEVVDGRWKVMPGYFLPALSFTLEEGVALVLSARLSLRYSDRADAFTAAAYEKLAAVLPGTVRARLADAVTALAERAPDARHTRVMSALARAWAEQRAVRITYRLDGDFDRVVWPLLIEPSGTGRAFYLLAWDPGRRAPRAYRIDRIRDAAALPDRFEMPPEFSLADHLASAFGIWGSDSPSDVELIFAASAAGRVHETAWHSSQTLEDLPDGRVRLRMRVGAWLEIRHWVLGWGEACEVIAPVELRDSVASAVASLAAVYGPAASPAPALSLDGPVPVRRTGSERRRPR